MEVFKDCQIVLDLTTSVGFKKKQELRKKITENGGVISYIVTKKSTHVVCNDPEKVDFSYKCKTARKYNIPVVSLDFIHDSVDRDQLLNTDDFLIGSKNKSEKLSSGTVAVTKSQNVRKQIKSTLDPGRLQVWHDEDKNCPLFNEITFEVAKYSLLKKQEKSVGLMFAVLEIHVANDEDLDKNREDSYKYRIASHYGKYMEINKFKHGTKEYRFVHTSDEALCVYSYLYQQKIQKQYEVTYEMMSPKIGSYKLYEMIKRYGSDESYMYLPVEELVDVIWKEAAGELEEIISVPLQNIKIEQVEEAEAILLRLKDKSLDIKERMLLMAEFYKAIPHNPKYFSFEYNKLWLSRKQDVCQLIKDMVSVSEANNWLTRGSTESKYKALRCHIKHMEPDSLDYEYVGDLVLSSLKGDKNLKIENIYHVQRFVEDDHYRSDLEPKELLFHSSKVENFVGILSRGLMLPKVVVDDLGGTRTDAGMLGNGIYFASSASTSAKYSKASVTKGTRLMVISEVALGKCMNFYKYDTTLEAPPSGYDSTHGVATTNDLPSEFKDDEYVIYNTNQQRMKYLVEFTIDNDVICPYSLQPESIFESCVDEIMEKTVIDLNDVKNVQDPMSKVVPGLISNDNSLVELKEVHIRGKLVDLAGEVVVIQEYRNQSSSPIEAKYVFPLDELAAVCGFEAFINGKHIVGEVKEKETAHKEYKKAISEGHGAYLMDQDEEIPDVFTVSVGNLPPGAFVLIKITYVTELQVEGEKISFNVPGSVAPWKQKYSSATEVKDKTWTTHQVEMGWCTVEVAIEMPFDIREIECTSHKIRMKRTASKAVIAMDDGQTIEDGFHLLVSLAEIHVPRMWVESYDGDTDNQACMLTFYPEFEAEEDTSIEVVMLLDLSNSMKGSPLTEAKKIILLTLQHLPSSATFNIVAFGTTYKELFPASRLKNKSNMKLAERFLESCQANMENTELYRPLHSFYLLKPESAVKNMYFTSESSYRNIFLISDGHINNEETTLEHVYKNSQHTRIFTFGVSSVANRHLLRALARVGAGAYEYFDSKSKSKWENKVKSQISKASQPGLTSVSVAWQQHDEELPPPIQAPRQITALFNGSRQVIYGFVPNCLMATLYAEIAGQQISTVVSTSDLSVTQGKILHRLTAKAVIRDWEDGVLAPDRTNHHVMKMNMKKDIIELSKKYSIVTKLTSFVAIEKREEGKTDKMEMSEYEFKHEFINCKESVDFLSYMQYEDELQDQEDSESSELVGTYSSDSVYDDFDDDELVYECEDDLEGSGEHEEEEPEYLERKGYVAIAPGRLVEKQVFYSEGSSEHEEEGSVLTGSCLNRRALLSVGSYGEESAEEDEDLEFGLFGDGELIRALRRREGGVAEELPRSMVEEESIRNIAKLCKSNVEMVLERSEKLDEWESKSSELESVAMFFGQSAGEVQSAMSAPAKALKSVSPKPRVIEQQQSIHIVTTACGRPPSPPMMKKTFGGVSPPQSMSWSTPPVFRGALSTGSFGAPPPPPPPPAFGKPSPPPPPGGHSAFTKGPMTYSSPLVTRTYPCKVRANKFEQMDKRSEERSLSLSVDFSGAVPTSVPISANFMSDNDDDEELEELEEELEEILKEKPDHEALTGLSPMHSRKTHGGLQPQEKSDSAEDLKGKFFRLGTLRSAPSSSPKSGSTARANLLSDIQKSATVRKHKTVTSDEKSSPPPVSWRTCGSLSDQKPTDIVARGRRSFMSHKLMIPTDDRKEMVCLIPQSDTDEDVPSDLNRKVEDYGIGVEVPSILCGKSELTIQSIASLLNLQKSDGHWEFSKEFDKLLNINSQICIDVLEKAGIKSLGRSIYVEILSLLATVISIYFVIYVVSPELIPLKKHYYFHESHYDNLLKNVTDKLMKVKLAQNFGDKDPINEFKNALVFCIEKTMLHPWVPDMLELGPDWFQVVGKMMPGFVEVN